MHNNCVVSKRIVQNAQIAADFTNMFLYKFAVTPVWAYVLKSQHFVGSPTNQVTPVWAYVLKSQNCALYYRGSWLRPYGRMY